MKKITILFIFILFYSCDKNSDNQDIKQSFTTTKAREWYSFKFKESTEWKENNESNNETLDWSNGEYSKFDASEVIEFPLIEKNTTSQGSLNISAIKKNTPLVRIAFIKTSNDSIIIRKRYYLPELNYLKKKQYDISSVELGNNKSDFTGLLITKKWNDEVLSYANIANHTTQELAMPSNFDTAQSNKSDKLTAKTTIDPDPYAWYINLGTVYVKASSGNRTFWFFNTYTGMLDLYKDSYFNYNTYSYNNYYYPTSGGSSTTTISVAQSIENSITMPGLDMCTQGVLTRLKDNTNSDIATVLTAFGTSTKYNLTVISETPKPGLNGKIPIATTERTTGLPAFNYTIKITKDYSSSTKLFKATILAHEMIHAYFISLVDNPSRDQEFGLFQDYPLLFQTWVNRKYPGSTDPKQHEEMANTYINIVGTALQEFQTGKPVPYGIPDEIYADLAWGGLFETTIFNTLYPEGSAGRIRIINEYSAESVGRQVGNSIPIGLKCN